MGRRKVTGAVDTNVLLRLVVPDDEALTQLAEELVQSGVFAVSDVVLTECAYVLEKVYSLPRVRVAKSVRSILRDPHLLCRRDVFEAALDMYTSSPKLSFVDCLVVAESRHDGTLPVFTFDKAMAKRFEGDVVLIQDQE